MGEDDRTGASLVRRLQRPAQGGPHAEHVEEGTRDPHGRHPFRVPHAGQGRAPELVRRHSREDPLSFLDVPVARRGKRQVARGREMPVRVRGVESDQAVRLRERKGLQEEGLENREHGRAGADAQGQREKGHRGESWRAQQPSKGLPEILMEGHESLPLIAAEGPQGQCQCESPVRDGAVAGGVTRSVPVPGNPIPAPGLTTAHRRREEAGGRPSRRGRPSGS